MHRLILAIIGASLFFSVSGCGQTGPLYLPGNPSRIESLPSGPAEPERQDEDEEEQSDAAPE